MEKQYTNNGLFWETAKALNRVAKKRNINRETILDCWVDMLTYIDNYAMRNNLTLSDAAETLSQPEKIAAMRRELSEEWQKKGITEAIFG